MSNAINRPSMQQQAYRNELICDVTLIIDKSGSMDEKDMPNGQSRWEAASEATFAVASRVMEFDPDGLNVWVFSNNNKCYRNVGPDAVKQIFIENEPFAGTDMAGVLKKALDEYFLKRENDLLKPNGEKILVITDGRPDDENAVADVLVEAAHKLHASDRLSVNFIQIGHDARATNYLNYLDTQLVPKLKAPCDFVETVKLETIGQQGIKQTLLSHLTKK